MARRLFVPVTMPLMILALVGLGWFGSTSVVVSPVAAQDEASPVPSSGANLMEINLEGSAEPAIAADSGNGVTVRFCVQYTTPPQSVGNPPPYSNSPVYLYWWQDSTQQWTPWVGTSTDGTGCAAFAGLVPNYYYKIRAFLREQSPVAHPDAGIVVNAWSPWFFIDGKNPEVRVGPFTLPNTPP